MAEKDVEIKSGIKLSASQKAALQQMAWVRANTDLIAILTADKDATKQARELFLKRFTSTKSPKK